MRFLLEKGAKLRDDVKNFATPWNIRESSNRAEMSVAIYSALLDADVTFDFEEVFHTALDKAELALAQRLLPKLRLSTPPNSRPGTPLSYASETYYNEPFQGLEGTPLSHAAEAGYEELVQQLLDAGFDPDAAVYDETKICTALTLAAENGHVATVELLWRGEAKTKFLADPAQFLLGSEYERICALVAQDIPDPNSTSESDERLLHRAAAHGHTRAIQTLLSRGADPRIPTATTLLTPLHYTVRSRNPAVLQLLFTHGAKPDIEARDSLGRTPLSYAAEGGCNAVVKFLLQHNARTDTHSTTLSTSLGDDVEKSRWDRSDPSPLPRHAVLEEPNPGGLTPLHYAASLGHAATVMLLLSHGAVVDARDAIGHTPLMLAAGDGARGAAQQLLDHGADSAATDDRGRTLLHYTAKGGWKGIAQLLLDTGKIDPGARDGEGKTALHHAARVRSVGVARVLLSKRTGAGTTTTGPERGLDLNTRDARGWTALHEAVEKSDNEMVIVLVQCSEVDPTIKNAEGETPLAIARKKWNPEVRDTLERRMGIESVGSD